MDQNVRELIEYSKKGILSRVIFKDERSDVTLFCLAAGTDISEHTSTKSGFVQVLEGDGIFKLEGKDIIMSAGTLIQMKGNAIHSLRAVKDTSFLLILINDHCV